MSHVNESYYASYQGVVSHMKQGLGFGVWVLSCMNESCPICMSQVTDQRFVSHVSSIAHIHVCVWLYVCVCVCQRFVSHVSRVAHIHVCVWLYVCVCVCVSRISMSHDTYSNECCYISNGHVTSEPPYPHRSRDAFISDMTHRYVT